MKHFTLTFLAIFMLISCSKDQPIISIEEEEDYYNCDNFFTSGDYTDFCTINTEVVNLIDSTIDGGGTVCRYIIPALDYDDQTDVAVSFLSLEDSDSAKNVFNARFTQSENDAESDTSAFHTEISLNGFKGYISEAQYANYGKIISVRNKNVLVTVACVFYFNWYEEIPCSYNTEQLTQLLKDVLDNM